MDLENKEAVKITVVCGANSQDFDNLTGQSVSEIKEALREVFNIPEDAQAIISGDNVENVYLLQNGDVLEFVRPSGTKG